MQSERTYFHSAKESVLGLPLSQGLSGAYLEQVIVHHGQLRRERLVQGRAKSQDFGSFKMKPTQPCQGRNRDKSDKIENSRGKGASTFL